MESGAHVVDGSRTIGSVAGFAIRSAVPLHYLRDGDGSDELAIAVGDQEPPPGGKPLREWLPRPDNPFHAKLWREGDRSRLWIDGLGWYAVDHTARRIEIPPEAEAVGREERLWGIPTSLSVLDRGDQTLHAASVEIDGRAVLFGAPGRHGKTTLAAAFHAAGARLLSEDTTCCRPSGHPVAIPGPAMLRLRRDSFDRLGVVDATVVGEDPDRIHLALADHRRGDVTPVSIAGLVLLRIDDRIRLERIEPAAAVQELWALAFKLPTDEDRARCFGAIADLAARIPVWNLYRPLEYGALGEVIATIDASVTREA
jgi:hypothetical protein